MSATPAERQYWRVGYHRDPLGCTPREICSWSHRFDDARQRVRSIYVAESPETSLREVIADFRPKLSAIRRFEAVMGADAASDLTHPTITAAWRRQHVLAPVRIRLDGAICDLTDVAQRQAVEGRHVDLLLDHGLQHLDLHEITTRRRLVTQTIASDLYDAGVAAIRFPSRLDGTACLAGFEGRTQLTLADEVLPLTDPPVEALIDVAKSWRLALEPAPPTDDVDVGWSDAATARMIAEEPW